MTKAERTARYVVDASAAIKLLLEDPLLDRALELFSLLTKEPPLEFYVPDLFLIECANVFRKYTILSIILTEQMNTGFSIFFISRIMDQTA